MFGEIMFDEKQYLQEVQQGQVFPREQKILEDALGDLITPLADFGGVLAGGAITSVFTNKEINDFDLYFPDAKSASQFVAVMWAKEYGYNTFRHATNKSLMFVNRDEDVKCQLIYYKFHPTVKDIFNDFDFTINMGAYDFKSKQFILHEDFLKHNSQRTIQVNTKTAYPIISVLRTQKYKERGYHVSKPQLVRLLLAVSQLGISTWKEMEDQLGGMYGYNVDDLFPKDEEFSLERALCILDSISPKILTALPSGSMDWDTIKKATVDIFPDEFHTLKNKYEYYDYPDTNTLLEYAYPDEKPAVPPHNSLPF